MPAFIGLRARKFWVATAAREACEHLIHTGHWPTPYWNAKRLNRCIVTVFDQHLGGMEAPEIWSIFDKYIRDEERRDKLETLSKLWPF